MNTIYKRLRLITICIGVLASAGTTLAQTFDIVDEGDYGNSHASYPPANATDGDFEHASRWAASFDGGSANLWVDLGSAQTVDDVGIAWAGGNTRSYVFEIRARSGTSGDWSLVYSGASSGSTVDLETYNIDDMSARQIRVKVFSNSLGTDWANIVELEIYGTSGRSGDNSDGTGDGTGDGSTGDFGLDPNAEPWENFDLSEWKIDTPAGEDSTSDCDAQTTEPYEWDSFPSRSEEYFFTHSDGGMRFVTEIGGGTTGNNCNSRTRSELREMLRGSNTSIDTSGDDGDYRNNWALGYQPSSHAGNSGESWGAREGTMSATLRVNEVTTTGSDSSRGRTVIGQIHADEDEPLRLNYKHRAGFAGGCIYAASEQRGGSDTTFMLVGNNTSCSQDPGSSGIALGELFSYEIENDGEDIIVTIRRGDRTGSIINSVRIDLNSINGNYDVSNDWMYFKAGAYSQNSLSDGGSSGDGDIVTFYRLDVTH